MSGSPVTELLNRMVAGDRCAESELLPLVYDELRLVAGRLFREERPDHTLQATALVHEVYFRLVGASPVTWASRSHFYAVTARMMRQILVDHARKRDSIKRGSGKVPVRLDEELIAGSGQCALVTALDEALERLETSKPRQAKVVELRFFGGLTEDQIAEVLGITARTVRRDWTVARAWLYAELSS